MWKTRFALYFYYLAIGLLTACAITIVVKLIVFPPCAPKGNTCVVDPWSAAGLEGAIMGVSATVLAILGAVAVAGWWTALNTRVADQVKGLYEDHKKEVNKQVDMLYEEQQKEVNARVDLLLKEQQKKVGEQLAEFRTILQSVRQDTDHVRELIERQTTQLQQTDYQATEVLAQMQNQLAASQKITFAMEEAAKRIEDLKRRFERARALWPTGADKALKQIEADKAEDTSHPNDSADTPSS